MAVTEKNFCQMQDHIMSGGLVKGVQVTDHPLAIASDGEPGPFVIWRSYLWLQDIILGISLVPP